MTPLLDLQYESVKFHLIVIDLSERGPIKPGKPWPGIKALLPTNTVQYSTCVDYYVQVD